MADGDKELSAIQALRKIECTHTHTLHAQTHQRRLASRCTEVCNEPPKCTFCL